MKKTILLSLAAAFLIYGCGKETPVDQIPSDSPEEPSVVDPVLKPIVFTSKASDDDVKVTLDGFNLKFTEGDKIAVASYNFASETSPIHSNYATYDGTETSASGTFTPASGSEYGATWAGSASAVSFYSYYPTTAAPSISGTTAAVTNIAATQDGTVSNILCWAKGSQVATAAEVTEGNAPSFNYSPVCALLKLNIVNNDDTNATSLSSLTLTATSGNNIAGSASLNLLTGTLSGGESSSVTYSPAEALVIAKNGGRTTLYIAFIPTTINSLRFSFSDTRENYVYSSTLDRVFPEVFLPGRLYERTLTITKISQTNVSGSLDKYNNIKFIRGFLKRTGTSTDTVSDMRISDATVNPLEILDYANSATSSPSYYMYFAWSEILKIFADTTTEQSFETNSITIEGKSCSVPSKANLESLVSTTRESNAPTINSVQKAWACVKVNLADSYTILGIDYSAKGFETAEAFGGKWIKGLLFFPDGGTVICPEISADNCNDIKKENEISSAQLFALVNDGCLFVPCVGGHSATPTWANRGTWGYAWSSTVESSNHYILTFKHGNSGSISIGTYAVTRHFPVMLIDAD